MDSRPYLAGPHVIRDVILEKVRSLPLGGEVLAAAGEEVDAGAVVAHLNPQGYLHFVNVARELDVSYNIVGSCIFKAEGDAVSRGEVIAARPAALGLLVAECRSPADGVIEKIYPSGHLTIRAYPIPVDAFVSGRVAETSPADRVVIITRGTLVQGLYGVGGEGHGPLVALGPASTGLPRGAPRGAVVVTAEALGPGLYEACLEAEASALVVPSAHLKDLPADPAMPIVLTEGFGLRRMTPWVFEVLASLAGCEASVSAATQLRAGVERPEVIVRHGPVPDGRPEGLTPMSLGRRTRAYLHRRYSAPRLEPGVRVRFTRRPNQGLEGEVVSLPPRPRKIVTGSVLPVAEVRLDDGRVVTAPRCNLEILELGQSRDSPEHGQPERRRRRNGV
ncbi:MAG: hypothetical protein C4551_08340 [Bacillota bacterium]|nr:MAG: hypothetical protein C4551_08340 [Bacillota bacterium]